MSEKSEALRLADALTEEHPFPRDIRLAAAELRRLHAQRDALRAELKEATEAINDPAVNNLRTLAESIRMLSNQRAALLEALDQCLNGTLIGGHTHNDNGLEVLAQRCGAPHIANELRRLANIARAAIKAAEEGK